MENEVGKIFASYSVRAQLCSALVSGKNNICQHFMLISQSYNIICKIS